MNPNETPIQTETPAPIGPKKMTGRTKLALWLLIAPSALFAVSFILGIISSIVFAVASPYGGGPLDGTYVAQSALRVLATVVGVIGFMTWLPGLVAGIILLATRQPQRKPNA